MARFEAYGFGSLGQETQTTEIQTDNHRFVIIRTTGKKAKFYVSGVKIATPLAKKLGIEAAVAMCDILQHTLPENAPSALKEQARVTSNIVMDAIAEEWKTYSKEDVEKLKASDKKTKAAKRVYKTLEAVFAQIEDLENAKEVFQSFSIHLKGDQRAAFEWLPEKIAKNVEVGCIGGVNGGLVTLINYQDNSSND